MTNEAAPHCFPIDLQAKLEDEKSYVAGLQLTLCDAEKELQRLRTENAALKRPVKLTVDEAFKLFRIFSQTPCRDGHVKAFEAVITYWRTQEAQKGEDNG